MQCKSWHVVCGITVEIQIGFPWMSYNFLQTVIDINFWQHQTTVNTSKSKSKPIAHPLWCKFHCDWIKIVASTLHKVILTPRQPIYVKTLEVIVIYISFNFHGIWMENVGIASGVFIKFFYFFVMVTKFFDPWWLIYIKCYHQNIVDIISKLFCMYLILARYTGNNYGKWFTTNLHICAQNLPSINS